MGSGALLTKLSDVLHAVSQSLLAPVIILLLAFVCYALFCIGSIIMEAIKERKNYKIETPKFLAALMAASDAELPNVIKSSGLLNRQKEALLTVYDYRMLPGDALVALIRKLVSAEETHYGRIAARNNTAAKLSPMAGLMGTLIPLGPGVAALGTGDTSALSNSLLIAFDTTVAGLIVAVICLAIGKIRSMWYNDYMTTLDAAMATMLQKIEIMREKGQIVEQQPSNYAFMFQEGLKKEKAARKGARQGGVASAAKGSQSQPVGVSTPPASAAAASMRTPVQSGSAPTAAQVAAQGRMQNPNFGRPATQARPQVAARPAGQPVSSTAPAAVGATGVQQGSQATGQVGTAARINQVATQTQAQTQAQAQARTQTQAPNQAQVQAQARAQAQPGVTGAQQVVQATGQIGNADRINQIAAQAQAQARAQAQAQAQAQTQAQAQAANQSFRATSASSGGNAPRQGGAANQPTATPRR